MFCSVSRVKNRDEILTYSEYVSEHIVRFKTHTSQSPGTRLRGTEFTLTLVTLTQIVRAGSYARSSLTTLIFLSEALRPRAVRVLKSHRETCHCPRKIAILPVLSVEKRIRRALSFTGPRALATGDIWISYPFIASPRSRVAQVNKAIRSRQ